MKKHLLVKSILIGFLGIWTTQRGQSQNLDQIAAMKPSSFFKEGVKITGNLAANHLFYSASGIDNRRTPFNFFYTGNLNVNLFGKINMPVTFSYSNQNVTFSQPFSQANPFTQPFNRLVLRPTYKGLTLHLGTCALTFSPYTVSGYRYKGVGLEYKSAKQPVYLSLMYGTLQPAVLVDTSYKYQNNRPSYKRVGMGIKLGYKHQQDVAELILFKAQDQISSLPYSLDSLHILPQQNVVGSIKLAKLFAKKLFVNAEFAVSGMVNDQRAPASARGRTLFNSFGGLLSANSSTVYQKAIRTSIAYKGRGITAGLDYSRVDPEYRTLGAYYFNNNLESISASFATQLNQGKISLAANAGLQRDNLDGKRLQTLSRWVGATTISWMPSERLNAVLSYSSFASYSNLRSSYDYLTQITPYNSLDTLNFRQINQSLLANINFQLSSTKEVSRTLSTNLIYQSGADQQGNTQNHSRLYNASLNYGHTLRPRHLTLGAAVTLSRNDLQIVNDLMWGPSLSVTKSWFDEQLRATAGITYSRATTRQADQTIQLLNAQPVSVLNTRVAVNYVLKKKHTLNLNVIYLSRNQGITTESQLPSFQEITTTLGYAYQFTVLQTARAQSH